MVFPLEPALRSPVLHKFGHESLKSSKVFQKYTHSGTQQLTASEIRCQSVFRKMEVVKTENEATVSGQQTGTTQRAEGNEENPSILRVFEK